MQSDGLTTRCLGKRKSLILLPLFYDILPVGFEKIVIENSILYSEYRDHLLLDLIQLLLRLELLQVLVYDSYQLLVLFPFNLVLYLLNLVTDLLRQLALLLRISRGTEPVVYLKPLAMIFLVVMDCISRSEKNRNLPVHAPLEPFRVESVLRDFHLVLVFRHLLQLLLNLGSHHLVALDTSVRVGLETYFVEVRIFFDHIFQAILEFHHLENRTEKVGKIF